MFTEYMITSFEKGDITALQQEVKALERILNDENTDHDTKLESSILLQNSKQLLLFLLTQDKNEYTIQ